jgi:transposase
MTKFIKFQTFLSDLMFIGIDVSKDSLAIFIDSLNQHSECRNEPSALVRLAKQLAKLKPQLICLEATGGYEAALVLALAKVNLPVAVVYPQRVREFAKGLGLFAKTDRIDAELLAFYARVAQPSAQQLDSIQRRELQALSTRREQLLEMRASEQNRLETAATLTRRSIEKHLRFLARQIREVDEELRQRISQSETWCAVDHRLQAVPGVGPVLSSTLISQLPELGNLSNKEIASLVGVAPFEAKSGKWKGKIYCRGGRSAVRRVLYMAALSAAKCNPVIKTYYERLCQRGKIKKVALIACARKLLVILNAMVRNQSSWEPKSVSPVT